jgi:hypothetical protein
MGMKTMLRSRIAPGLLAGTCAFAATLAVLLGFGEAEAITTVREVSSSMCHAKYDNLGTALENAGALNNLGTANVSIYCPVISDTEQFAPDVNSVTVFGFEGNDGGYSAACSCYLDPVDCVCGTTRSWSNAGQGVVASNISLAQWGPNQQVEFYWLIHRLTPNSTLVGYSMVGTE